MKKIKNYKEFILEAISTPPPPPAIYAQYQKPVDKSLDNTIEGTYDFNVGDQSIKDDPTYAKVHFNTAYTLIEKGFKLDESWYKESQQIFLEKAGKGGTDVNGIFISYTSPTSSLWKGKKAEYVVTIYVTKDGKTLLDKKWQSGNCDMNEVVRLANEYNTIVFGN